MDRSDSFNILDQILNDQSPLKGDNDIEEDNLLEPDEPEEIEIGLSINIAIHPLHLLIVVCSTVYSEREGAQLDGHV